MGARGLAQEQPAHDASDSGYSSLGLHVAAAPARWYKLTPPKPAHEPGHTALATTNRSPGADSHCPPRPELPAPLAVQRALHRVPVHGGDTPDVARPGDDRLRAQRRPRRRLRMDAAAHPRRSRRGVGRHDEPQEALRGDPGRQPGHRRYPGSDPCPGPCAGLARLHGGPGHGVVLCPGNGVAPLTHPRHSGTRQGDQRRSPRYPRRKYQRHIGPGAGGTPGRKHLGAADRRQWCGGRLYGACRCAERLAPAPVETRVPPAHPPQFRRPAGGQDPGNRAEVRSRAPHPAGDGSDCVRHQHHRHPVCEHDPRHGARHPDECLRS